MGRVLVDRDTVEEMKKAPLIGSGKEGQCYFTNDPDVIVKIFYYYDKYRQVHFDNRYHEQIAYPIDILIDKESKLITGYTMPYLKGQKFENGFPKYMKIEDLKNAYYDMRDIIMDLGSIYTNDNCLENMFYDVKEKCINLIDTSRWYNTLFGYVHSVCDFNFFMTHALFQVYDYNNSEIKKTKRIKELYKFYDEYLYYERQYSLRHANYESVKHLTTLFEDLLEEIETLMSEYKGEKVKTIGDISIL